MRRVSPLYTCREMLLGYIHSFWLLLQTWIKNLAFTLFCYGSGEALYDFMNLVITHFLVFAASFLQLVEILPSSLVLFILRKLPPKRGITQYHPIR